MPTIEVTMDLPFHLRARDTLKVSYDDVCREMPQAELAGCDLEITFSGRAVDAHGDLDLPGDRRTTVSFRIVAPPDLTDGVVDQFAILDCREILNRIIAAYQATTGEVDNAGFISPLGTSDMQLFAEILVDGQDFRDRRPPAFGHINTLPLGNDQAGEFQRYVVGEESLPLAKLFITGAMLSQERGQYPLAVVQAATAVELRTTQVVSARLREAGWSAPAIRLYERRVPLSEKLELPRTDPRSLRTYFDGANGFADVLRDARGPLLLERRNGVVHRGHLPSRQEALQAVQTAQTFLRVVS